jgi:hypothetical protein
MLQRIKFFPLFFFNSPQTLKFFTCNHSINLPFLTIFFKGLKILHFFIEVPIQFHFFTVSLDEFLSRNFNKFKDDFESLDPLK